MVYFEFGLACLLFAFRVFGFPWFFNLMVDSEVIFGHFGLSEMGIAGAGLANTVAEYVAIIAFFFTCYGIKRIKNINSFYSMTPQYDETFDEGKDRKAELLEVEKSKFI